MAKALKESEDKLIAFFQALSDDPAGLANWRCLHIEIVSIQQEINKDVIQAEAYEIIHNHMKEGQGTVIFLGSKDIYILCRDVVESKLSYIASKIAQFIRTETGGETRYTILSTSVMNNGTDV